MLKKLFLSTLLLGLVAVASISLMYIMSPIPKQIRQLSKGYVRSIKNGNDVTYEVVKNKPSGWISFKALPFYVPQTFVLSEDWNFYRHMGLDLDSLIQAIVDSLEKGKRLRGASTIDQQVAKNLFTNGKRSIFRKAEELFWTFHLQYYLPKVKILEIYMNIVELGPNVYGIKDASQYYFSKEPSDLKMREVAFLAMLLPGPKRYSQSFREKKLTRFAKRTVDDILEKMRMGGLMDRDELALVKDERFSWERVQDEVSEQTSSVEKELPLYEDEEYLEVESN